MGLGETEEDPIDQMGVGDHQKEDEEDLMCLMIVMDIQHHPETQEQWMKGEK